MTERMKYINIMGKMDDIDNVIEKYISKHDIQLEYTFKELANEKELHSIQSPNPYFPILKKAEKIFKTAGLELDFCKVASSKEFNKEEAIKIIEYAAEYTENMSIELDKLRADKEMCLKVVNELNPFSNLDFKIEDFKNFEFIKYQFGKMPISSFKQFESFLYKDPEILFVSGHRDSGFLYGVYFASEFLEDKIDSVFSSLHFEKMNLPFMYKGEYLKGSPLELYREFLQRLEEINKKIINLEKIKLIDAHEDKHIDIDVGAIACAYKKIQELAFYYDTRKYAAKTANDFYIFVGWMVDKDAERLESEILKDPGIVFISEENNDSILSTPPIKLKNNFLFKPFEMFVKMYGLPTYGEIDPTPFVAITYTILFGIMFGDVGQGFVISMLGLFLNKRKGTKLGAIMTVIGISSMVFGVLFGSIFGFEFTPLWMHPAETVNINTILMLTVVFGVFLIFTSMSLNIINAIKKKEYKQVIFDPHGIMGLIFYIAVMIMVYFTFIGKGKIALWFMIIFLVIPFITLTFRKPIIKFLQGDKKIVQGSKGLFLFETLIGAFELLLSYFTNTVSFVRVGAFALSHASMMGVVLMLSKTAAGNHNILVLVFGNLLVMGLEGLIVGIQVLRLEFYEMFSLFYSETGRGFVPYRETVKK